MHFYIRNIILMRKEIRNEPVGQDEKEVRGPVKWKREEIKVWLSRILYPGVRSVPVFQIIRLLTRPNPLVSLLFLGAHLDSNMIRSRDCLWHGIRSRATVFGVTCKLWFEYRFFWLEQGEIFLLVSEMIFIVNKFLCQGFIISFLFLETQLFLDLLS